MPGDATGGERRVEAAMRSDQGDSVSASKGGTRKTRGRRKAASKPRPDAFGWATSDEHEVERRRLRAKEEKIAVRALEPELGYFGTFATESQSGESYRVEIRAIDRRINTCECPDHRINRLGTCKHVEAVLLRLEGRGKRRFAAAARAGSLRVEVFLDPRDERARVEWPRGLPARAGARALLAPFFSADGTLLGDATAALPALEQAVARAERRTRAKVRISTGLGPWRERLEGLARRRGAREAFERDVADGKQSRDLVRLPLYPYQCEGMAHLAFTGRALLADEMGLGKTVQAIAACELLRRREGVERVLVVSPASLKAEWQEQIAHFAPTTVRIIEGTRPARLRQYRERAFFYLSNYEQIRKDYRAINELLAPEVVILDEAQRIKNWNTVTAQAVKRLASPYAFVLTGTPLENRIDEVYSIAQFLDPHLFGPLFRFNREFYTLDHRGRPVGYRNLDEMHRRLRTVMLRRRKEEVEGDLPARTVNQYFVPMHEEQIKRYRDYEDTVARLAHRAQQRPLTKEEMERLQLALACMRMLCDTPYILDATCRICPKLEELESVLGELIENGHKLIVFSEWLRMLELVGERLEEWGVGHAWHTGSIPQGRRRAEIRRFKTDPECRVFLSTESGGVGLNLQVADVVVNLDLPWNPARLEQRIARAWRKHQTRPVQVINLVSEDTIEHRMLGLLEAKQGLAQGVVDGDAGVKAMKLPSGRAAFLERVRTLVGERLTPAAPRRAAVTREDPFETVRKDVAGRWAGRLERLEASAGENGSPAMLAVLDRVDGPVRDAIAASVERHCPGGGVRVEVLDRDTYAAVQRLVEAGLLRFAGAGVRVLHDVRGDPEEPGGSRHEARRTEARRRMEALEAKRRMAQVLAGGGFSVEALAPMREALEAALESLATLRGQDRPAPLPLDFVRAELGEGGMLPPGAAAAIGRIRDAGAVGAEEAEILLAAGFDIWEHAARTVGAPAVNR